MLVIFSISKIKEEVEKCTYCNKCLSVCPTYINLEEELLSPPKRIDIAKKIINNEKITQEEFNSIYSCPKCGTCTLACPQEIDVSEIITVLRIELRKQGYSLLENHQRICNSIQNNMNSVNKSPDIRWDWVKNPELFEKSSSTLFFVGCLPCYFLKEGAQATIDLLNALNIDFRLYKDEGCCGSFYLDVGNLNDAEKLYKQNLDKFDDLGIKELIVTCAGCYKAFKKFYPLVIGESIPVKHIIELAYDALKKGNLKFIKSNEIVTYQDPCHFGRGFKFFDEPRELLKQACNYVDMDNIRENSICCGANSAVRAAFRDISMKIALKRLEEAEKKAPLLVSSCAFCTFNLSYAARKNERPIKVRYITEVLAENIKK